MPVLPKNREAGDRTRLNCKMQISRVRQDVGVKDILRTEKSAKYRDRD